MSVLFKLHPDNPQIRLLKQAAQLINSGGLLAIPTDSSYAIVARLDDKEAVSQLRRLRGLDDRHHLTLLCHDLSQLGHFARVDNQQYRLLKAATPGPWTFILEASKDVPRRVSHPSRKTIGIRVPDHPITLLLIEEVGSPLLSTTLIPIDDTEPLNDPEQIMELYSSELKGVIDSGTCSNKPTTVIDLSTGAPEVLRLGSADPASLGL